jgi:hypothetical protein
MPQCSEYGRSRPKTFGLVSLDHSNAQSGQSRPSLPVCRPSIDGLDEETVQNIYSINFFGGDDDDGENKQSHVNDTATFEDRVCGYESENHAPRAKKTVGGMCPRPEMR